MRIRIWPSKMGCTVTSGPLRFDVFLHGGCRRLLPDNSLTGYRGDRWADVPRGTFEEMAAACLASWSADRMAWQQCE